MKIERAWLRIIVSVIVGGIAGYAWYVGCVATLSLGGAVTGGRYAILFLSIFLAAPAVAAVLVHVLTPREKNNGHTRCGKCGYILKGLTEPRRRVCELAKHNLENLQ